MVAQILFAKLKSLHKTSDQNQISNTKVLVENAKIGESCKVTKKGLIHSVKQVDLVTKRMDPVLVCN